MRKYAEFMIIKCSDNDYTELISKAFEVIIPVLESSEGCIDRLNEEHIIKYLADSVARVIALEHSYYGTSKDYEEDFNHMVQYLTSNLSITHHIDACADSLMECVFRKQALKDFNLEDIDDFKLFLKMDKNNFMLIPLLFHGNGEEILVRINLDREGVYKSQMVIY